MLRHVPPQETAAQRSAPAVNSTEAIQAQQSLTQHSILDGSTERRLTPNNTRAPGVWMSISGALNLRESETTPFLGEKEEAK